MKSKVIGLFLLSAFLTMNLTSVFATEEKPKEKKTKRRITKMAIIYYSSASLRSTIFADDYLIGECDGENIAISFVQDLGNVDLAVYNENGNAVYENAVYAAEGSTETFDILSWSEGEYEVMIESENGRSFSGYFFLEDE